MAKKRKSIKSKVNRSQVNRASITHGQNMEYIFYLWAVIVALTPVLSTYGIEFGYSPDLHMSSILQVGGVVLFAICLLTQRPKLLISNQLIAIVLMYIWMAISVLWVINRYESAIRLLDWGCSLLIMLTIYFFWHEQIAKDKVLERVYFVLMISGFIACAVSLSQYWSGYNKIPQAAVPGSFFSNKNMAAQYLLLTLPLVVYWWMQFFVRGQLLWHYVLTVAIALFIVSIFHSFALAAWLSLALQIIVFIALLCYFVKVRNWQIVNRQFVLSIVAILVLVLLILPIPKYKQTAGFTPFIAESELLMSQTDKKARQSNVRIPIWTNSWEMIKEHWLKGIGAGNWVVEYPQYHQRVMIDRVMTVSVKHDNAHNDYIEIVAELGVLGTILFILFLVFSGQHIVRVFKKGSQTQIILMLVPTLALVGIYFDAVFSFPLQQPVPIYWVFMYSAIVVAISHQVQPLKVFVFSATNPTIDSKLNYLQYAVIFAVFYGALQLFQMHSRWYQSEIHKRGAIIAADDGRFDIVKQAGYLSYSNKPEHKELAHAYAVGLREMGQLEEADKYFDIVLSGYPYTITYLTNAINNALQMRNIDKGLALLERYHAMRTTDFDMNRLYGLVLLNEKRDLRGLDYLKRAVELEPNNPESSNLRNIIIHIENQVKQQQAQQQQQIQQQLQQQQLQQQPQQQ